MQTGTESESAWERARRLAGLVWELARARGRLFLLEWQEERLRLVAMLALAAACVWCTGMALVLLSFTVAVVFWEEHRVLVLLLLTLAWAAGAALSLWSLRRRMRAWRPFAATREQFRKDATCFGKLN